VKNCSAVASVVMLAVLSCVACDAHITGDKAAGTAPGGVLTPGGEVAGGGKGSGGSAGVATASCEAIGKAAPLPTRLRRLTPLEYTNTLRVLLGDGIALPAVEFPPDAALGAFHNAAALLRVTDLLADGLAQAAQKLAQTATTQLPQLMGCDPTQGDEAGCVRGFLKSFGARAYRRPLSTAETERLFVVYQQGRMGADARAGVALALEVVFQSPHLLYRTELGAREATESEVAVTQHELASEISYLVTLAPPDAELTRAAAAGELNDAGAREAQARRLLQLPSAKAAMQAFASEWLDIGKLPTVSKDPAMFPAFSADSARTMMLQTEQLFSRVVFEGDGKLRSLLGGGLLTEPSVLAAHAGSQWSSPTHRGKLIRNQFLCQVVPPPPPGLIVTVPPAVSGVTTRQRMLTHASDPTCAACHVQMDPLGFAFEHYDAVGRFRADENGLAIDASGQIGGGTDADGAFDGAAALSQRLAESADVRACLAEQWATFAVGGEVDPALKCALAQTLGDFRAERLSLPELLIGVVVSEAFVKRRVNRP
jgi:Protein of unknown function (DUF1588)/Protein of unknown function (DUF1592)/Protein of unknown function (DUF1595)/Protein of unknown function (DUF1587)/Protein of unknown function (DUF1585)